MQIYLDNAATTRPCAAAVSAIADSIENFGNPSSLHCMGIASERLVEAAREEIARAIGAKSSEIFFTSGGTEANNLAILGGAKAHNGNRIVTTGAEHPSVAETIKELGRRGFEMFHVEHFGGPVSQDSLKTALEQPVALVSIHHVNNETGVVQDVASLGKIIKQAEPKTLFHVDGVQSFCKLPIDVAAMNIDLLSLSAHKVGGIKGCGALYVRGGVHLRPMIFGGGHEGNLRSGTQNVPGIAAFAAAVKHQMQNMRDKFSHVSALNEKFLAEIDRVGGVQVNGENLMPYILNISVEGVRPEVLLNALSAKGVCISAGAACSSNRRQKAEDSAVLRSYGLSADRVGTAVRISFCSDNTDEEITDAAGIFMDCVKDLRRLPKLR